MLSNMTIADLRTYAKLFIRHHNYEGIETHDRFIDNTTQPYKLYDLLVDNCPLPLAEVDIEETLNQFIRSHVAKRKLHELGGDSDLEDILDI